VSQLGRADLTQVTYSHRRTCFAHWLVMAWTVCLVLGFGARTLAQGAVPAAPLPEFRADPNLLPNIVLNAGQGLGQCHWLDPNILSVPYVGWAYDATETGSGWASIEPQDGVFNWAPFDEEIAIARNQGKHVWLQLLTTEGQTPKWAQDAGVTLVGSRGGTPVPWNETYQRLLRRALHAMAARYDDNPTVDAVNIMGGGCYGEMAICAARTDTHDWEQAGYNDVKWIETVKQIIDIYLEADYEWPDGSHTHGFLNKPVVLQVGAGLYGHTTVIIPPVVQYAISTYGMRVWLKYNGYGGGFDMGWLFRQYDSLTRVGYEPAGNNQDFVSQPKKYVQLALQQHASYLCLQSAYFAIADQPWQEARELAARYLGTQIVSLGVKAPEVVEAGEAHVFTTTWENRGTVPLMRPQREGIKDVPSSYDVLVAFVDRASEAVVFEYTFTPAVPTTRWHSAQPITLEQTIPIPTFVPAGQYDLRVALVNPSLPAGDELRSFRLVNADLSDGQGRYKCGRITVLNPTAPSATATPTTTPGPGPTATATPTPGPGQRGNWFSQWLHALWGWLRGLLNVFQ